MKRARSLSLGAKLNLSLLAFLLLLGAATSAIIVYGFQRTQDSAQQRSDAALEDGGRLALYAVAGGAAEQGGLLFEAVAEIGRRAALYVETRAQEGNPEQGQPVSFDTSSAGHRYDPNPDRAVDLVVVNGVSLDDPRVQGDIAFSASLDTIFPVLLQGFAGEIGGRNLDPTAIVFISTNGVTRYYPPIGIHDRLSGDADFSERMTELGPERNPERKTIWTAPYEDGAGEGLIVTARTPVYDGEVFRGSMEVDVSMTNVLAQISQIKPTPRGFAFYVDSAGLLLESDAYDLLTVEAENGGLADVLNGMRSTPSDDFRTTDAKIRLGGEDYYVAYSNVPVLGGSLAVAAPRTDITAAAAGIGSGIEDEGTRTLQVMVAAMTVLFVVGLLGAGMLNRNAVIKPINSLVAAARAVGSGDLEARVSVAEAGDELSELGATFNSMVEQLRESERALEDRVQQRTRELQAVLDTSKALSSTLELQPLLDDILDHLQKLVDYDGAAVLLVEGDRLVQLAVRRPASGWPVDGAPSSSPVASYSTVWDALLSGEPVIIDDVRGESAFARAYRAQVRFDLELTPLAYVRAWAAVPLTARDRVIGMLAMAHEEPGGFDQRDVELAGAIAAQAAVAIENARLFDETRRQGRENETLVRADAELFRSLNLDTVLQALVDVAVDVVGVDTSLVTIWDREAGTVEVRASRNLAPGELEAFKTMLPPGGGTLPDDVEPNIYESLEEVPVDIREVMRPFGKQAAMDVPIRSAAGEILGGYGVGYAQPHVFTADERQLLLALAERAAVAMQNAALYERAQRAGSLEERQRLARELHDSVSQALYGIALGTRTARLRLGDDPHNAAEPIDYVASLAQAGLAEMRALIFELRPESLEQEGLIAALEKHAASTRARYGLDVRLELVDEPDCTIQVKEALYRIAQEALHNVVKHAQAQQVNLSLRQDGDVIVLTVSDDGRGFDVSASFPGHVGLQSMPERAARLGGTVEVESTPGSGTMVVARLPASPGP